MSPEQVQFVRDDPRSDLFALGVMLYHLATGKRPFGAPETVRGLRRRLFTPPTPPRSLRPDMPPWLQEVILRCLEVDPARRHPSAAELAFDLSHADQVLLTARAERLDSGGGWKSVRRWAARLSSEPVAPCAAAQPKRRGPVLLVAVDVAAASAPLLEALRRAVQRMLHAEPQARLACMTVMREHSLSGQGPADAQDRSGHAALRVKLEQWAHPLGGTLDLQHMAHQGRLTFHVLEAQHPAAAIVEHASRNAVDHIVMGARSSGSLRRYLGSVSAQVVAEADCSVTVVRAEPDSERA
jgi:nucleotide-binding universal stress UspA family protein